jgi:hypothetical protein
MCGYVKYKNRNLKPRTPVETHEDYKVGPSITQEGSRYGLSNAFRHLTINAQMKKAANKVQTKASLLK